MHTSAIYKIENIVNGKVYIGQTSWLEKRQYAHLNKLEKGIHDNIHLQRAYNKYGKNSFVFDIVEYCTPDMLDEREVYWISFYDSFNHGYNQTLGGGGNRGYHATDEAKSKMRQAHYDCAGENNPMYGKNIRDYMSPEAYERWCAAKRGPRPERRGIPMSSETKQRLSASLKDFYRTHSHCMKGVKRTTEQIQHSVDARAKAGTLSMPLGSNPNAKAVVCVNTGTVYSCIKEAAMDTDANASSISMCVNHKCLSSGTGSDGKRLVWVFFEEYNRMTDREKLLAIENAQNPILGRRNINAKAVCCTTTGEIFGSVCDAARKYGIDNSAISKRCRAGGGFYGKFNGEKLYWQYQ